MYYDVENAEAITVTGQMVIQYIEHKTNEYFNRVFKTKNVSYVIASDTDSIYIVMGNIVKMLTDGKNMSADEITTMLHKIVNKEISPFLNKQFDILYEYMNCNESVLAMKREYISKTGLWVGAKNYILDVYDAEGVRYQVPDLKITGIAAVKSSTPAVCRKTIKTAFEKIIREGKESLQEYIAEFRIKFDTLTPEEIAFPRGVNNISGYKLGEKGLPIHVAASLVYNGLLEKLNLTEKYEKIKDGEKIKFLYLRQPNKAMSHVVAFPVSVGYLPKEFGLHEFVDREVQFEKTFLSPIQAVADIIGWSLKKENSLESLFSL